jgi:hypothetical protein
MKTTPRDCCPDPRGNALCTDGKHTYHEWNTAINGANGCYYCGKRNLWEQYYKKLPCLCQRPDEYERGWNDCIQEMEKINSICNNLKPKKYENN